MQTIHFTAIQPFVRLVRDITITEAYRYNDIFAYDHRLIYIRSGNGIMRLADKEYALRPGALVVWQPGLKYGLYVQGNDTIELTMVNFDYTCAHPLSYLLVPDKADDFEPAKINDPCFFDDVPEFNAPIFLEQAEFADGLLQQLTTEYVLRKQFSDMAMRSLFLTLLTDVCRRIYLPEAKIASKADCIIEYIQQHFQQDLTYQSLAEVFHYHPNHINRLIVQSTGLPIHRYLLHIRVEKAYNLLINQRDLPLSKICECTGFGDPMNFSKCFKRLTGFTPSAVRAGKQRSDVF